MELKLYTIDDFNAQEVEVMHKIDLTNGILKPYRFVCLQLVVIMFMILLTYKWAFTFTQVIEQSILINVTFGIIGFLVMLIVHKLIHKLRYFILSKGDRIHFDYKKGLLVSQTSDKYLNIYQFTITMIAPLIIITAVLLIIFNFYAYSSIIFISSIHIGYCLIDLYLVGTAWSNRFKYIQNTNDGLYMYYNRPYYFNNQCK